MGLVHVPTQIQALQAKVTFRLLEPERLAWNVFQLYHLSQASSFFFWVTGELSTLRQMKKVPNEPGLSPKNGLENAFLSDQSMASNPRKGQAKPFGAKTTSQDGKAGHVMTHVCHRAR